MLNDSTSPQNDLEKLCSWLELPETKEVLEHLRDQRRVAEVTVHAPPDKFLSHMDGVMIENLRHQNIGKTYAFSHLEAFLNERKLALQNEVERLSRLNP